MMQISGALSLKTDAVFSNIEMKHVPCSHVPGFFVFFLFVFLSLILNLNYIHSISLFISF